MMQLSLSLLLGSVVTEHYHSSRQTLTSNCLSSHLKCSLFTVLHVFRPFQYANMSLTPFCISYLNLPIGLYDSRLDRGSQSSYT